MTSSTTTIVCLNVKFSLKEERVEEFIDVILADQRDTLANERGAHIFEVGRSDTDPNQFFLHEQYENEAAFQYHTETPHFAAYQAFCKTDPFTSPTVVDKYHTLGKSAHTYVVTRNPMTNKGHSFSHSERELLHVRGLYPAGDPHSLELRVEAAMEQLRKKATPLEKYVFLHTIQDSDETLFYAVLTRHTSETMPIVYTPTVGEACQQWSRIYKHTPRGLYISLNDRGHVRKMLDNYPHKTIKAIVFTDGERILGLGDQGTNGMGIPIGKLALYTTCAGIRPDQCLPVHIDVGTDRVEYREDPHYMGLKQPRERGEAYDELVGEFIRAAQDAYGRNVLLQFEDFGNTNAFRLLDRFKDSACTFNDDIQGTASVVLAGIISSLPLAKKSQLAEHTYLFYGAGEAGVGIAHQVATYIANELQVSEEEARKQIWLVDSQGLISSARNDRLAHHKLAFQHSHPDAVVEPVQYVAGENVVLLDAVRLIRPTALIGVSAQGQTFTEGVCKELLAHCENPLIFALSNPTSQSECTAQQAYEWTNGKCVFASGSPFDPVTLADGRTFVPGQGNNAYIFPGVGLGVVASGAVTITDEDLTVAAICLASQVSAEQLATGCAYPPLENIREVSLKIAAAVAQNVIKRGRATPSEVQGLDTLEAITAKCASIVYVPRY